MTARGSTLQDLHGIGPSGAARLLADVGDIHRFATRDRFASWNGTAPLDASSGDQRRQWVAAALARSLLLAGKPLPCRLASHFEGIADSSPACSERSSASYPTDEIFLHLS